MNTLTRFALLTLLVMFHLIFVPAVDAQAEETGPNADGSVETTSEPVAESEVGGSSSDDFSWSVGGGFIASPRPYIGAKARVFPIPVVTMRHKRFFFQGIRGGFDFVQREKLTANVFAQANFKGLEPDDSLFLHGMEERRKSADAGVEVVYRAIPVGFRFAFLSDVLGRSNGQEASLMAITGAPLGRVLVLFGAGPRWLSADRVNYYYGVRPEEARPGRPAYQAPSTWSIDLNVTAIVDITSKWKLLALVNREGLGSGIESSPLVERTSAYSLIFSVTRSF